MFLSSAASIALSKGCSEIYYGAHADDAAGSAYPDCSSEFNAAINDAIYLGSGKQIKVVAPFINASKAQVVKRDLSLMFLINTHGAVMKAVKSHVEGVEHV